MRTALDYIRGIGTAAAAAFQFLSRLPVPVTLHYTDAVFRRSVIFYPLVGAVLGALLWASGALLQGVLPALPAAAVLLALWVALTGALHLDGLMDTADGVLSHRPRERMLEIMKDSRVGAMGVVVCMLVLLLKWSLLAALLGRGSGWSDLAVLPLVLLWSRCAMAAALVCWPYARQAEGGGMGSLFAGLGFRHLAGAVLLAAALTLAAGWGLVQAGAGGTPPVRALLLLPAAAAAGCALLGVLLHRKLGGLTGDTYGAINEGIETLLLILWVGIVSY
ncbi:MULTISPECIES: adenosylcobinamide-GDP ribazoletransferase [Paenibacillus]|uniref:adenosylcobinamide-GDP ribazoletransferase n=1 Tax=Paenibacillus TaxID=44249 RepID=UPI0022B88C5D|nr:adenosylcobinamide-GDP ribazoletransferase [Paenibacillus caseinilyticus]MCZ8519379.1 adenosylcobinamide-GDP ribazoletransferase [Paenibacillus caseinilyticus]